jgi:hypothetical protein
MTGMTPVHGDIRTSPGEKIRKRLGLLGTRDRIVTASRNQYPYILKRGKRIGNQGNHGPQQQCTTQGAGMEQQQCSRNVGTVGKAYRYRGGIAQIIAIPGFGDKTSQFTGSIPQVIQVKYTFGIPAEEARHAVLQHLAPRTKQRRSGRQRLAERNEIALVSPGTVEQQHRSSAAAGARHKPVYKSQILGAHRPCPAVACGNRSGGNARSIRPRWASYIGGSFK